MICNECETVAHCTNHGCIPKTTKKDAALKLALEAYMAAGFGNSTDFALQRKAYDLALQALAEQPAQQQQIPKSITCPFCESEHVPGWLHDYNMDRDAHGEQPAQPQQEPVAWMNPNASFVLHAFIFTRDERNHPEYSVPVYTSPPTLSLAQRQARSADTWVGLTANEVEEIFQKKLGYYPTIYAVEAKLKEKNA